LRPSLTFDESLHDRPPIRSRRSEG
jgi:hypothetical protein